MAECGPRSKPHLAHASNNSFKQNSLNTAFILSKLCMPPLWNSPTALIGLHTVNVVEKKNNIMAHYKNITQLQDSIFLVNMPHLIQKHSGYGDSWPLPLACSQNQAKLKCIQFGSLLPKKVHAILRKTCPDLIWIAWSGLGQTHLVWMQARVLESLGPVLAGCKWPTTSFRLSDSVVFFHRQPSSYSAILSWLWFDSGWLSQVLAKGIWGNPDWMQIRYVACLLG